MGDSPQLRLGGRGFDGGDGGLHVGDAPLVQIAGKLPALHLLVQFRDQFATGVK